MCQCGCADFDPDCWLPGPCDLVYLLTSYPSCRECSTPAGVTMDRVTRREAVEHWQVDFSRLPELTGDFPALPVIDPEILREKLKKWAKKNGKHYDVDGALDDATRECFEPAARETLEKWVKEQRRDRRTRPR